MDLIERQTAIEAITYFIELCNKALDSATLGGRDRYAVEVERNSLLKLKDDFKLLPSAQPERLTDDDFETIRIHLNAYKEKLCNQHRWKEAEEYQRIIDRFMAFAFAQPERKTGKWELLPLSIIPPVYKCSACGRHAVRITTGCLVNRHEESYLSDFCPSCGADMRGEQNE